MIYKIIIERDKQIVHEREVTADEAFEEILKIAPQEKVTTTVPKQTKKKKEKKISKSRPIPEERDEDENDSPAKSSSAKRLTPDDMQRMKAAIRAEVPVKDIAEEFGVSLPTVYVMKKKVESETLPE